MMMSDGETYAVTVSLQIRIPAQQADDAKDARALAGFAIEEVLRRDTERTYISPETGQVYMWLPGGPAGDPGFLDSIDVADGPQR